MQVLKNGQSAQPPCHLNDILESTKHYSKRLTEKPNEPPKPHGIDIMTNVFHLLSLALKHAHTFHQWRTIWTMYLAKDPGTPYIHHLWTQHLVEADWNLLLKWHSSQGSMKKAWKKAHQLNNCQGGSCTGCSAINLACKKVTSHEIICIIKTPAINTSNNAASCFNCMIENCQNLSCCQHRADTAYLKLHMQTHCKLCYYVKHAFKMSTCYNMHSTQNPWYSAGQGTGDATARWVVLADSLSSAYLLKTAPWLLQNPARTTNIVLGFDAFMDNTMQTNIEPADAPPEQLYQTGQTNLTRWSDLLQASSGRLIPQKCIWFHFNWMHHSNGKTSIQANHQPDLMVQELSGTIIPIIHLMPKEAHQYLGVFLMTNGNYRKEQSTFIMRNQQFIHLPFDTLKLNQVFRNVSSQLNTFG